MLIAANLQFCVLILLDSDRPGRRRDRLLLRRRRGDNVAHPRCP
jgi:hypothetical protein